VSDYQAALQPTKTLSRTLLSDQIYDVLIDAIAAGRLEPGQRLVESEIARQLSVSQAPVREALKRLAHGGMVLQLPRRGSFVATIDEKTARRTYQLRALLEDHAAREFCSYADDTAVEKLAGVLTEMRAAAAADDLRQVIEQDINFHRTVWESTGNDLLARMWPLVEGSLRAVTTVSNRIYFGSLSEIAETHQPLIDSLHGNDPDVAGPLFREHVTVVWHRVDAAAAGGKAARSTRKSGS
jgi:DNA-binding GntR family transcriptional regulator